MPPPPTDQDASPTCANYKARSPAATDLLLGAVRPVLLEGAAQRWRKTMRPLVRS